MLLMQHILERVINFHARAQGFLEGVKANGLNHEFLKIHGVIRVFSTIENVQHGRGQRSCTIATKIFVQRLM